jgi:ribonuclease R
MAKPPSRKPKSFKPKSSGSKPPKPRDRAPQGLPDRATLLNYIRETGEIDRAEMARVFGLKGADRKALREMLRELEEDGTLARRSRKGYAESGALPPVGVVDVTERDPDGDLMVKLTRAEDAPLVRLAPDRAEAVAGAPGLGDRLLVRFETLETGEVEARLIKKLGQSAHRVLGVVRKARREVRVEPVDRRSKGSLLIPAIWCWLRSASATAAMDPSTARSWRSSAARTSRAPPP